MMDPQQVRPGVREIADGIFLYTTRVSGTTSGGPTFVYEVESARADRRGVRFGIDFSASTNLVLLPSATASVTLASTTTAGCAMAGAKNTRVEAGGGGRGGSEGDGATDKAVAKQEKGEGGGGRGRGGGSEGDGAAFDSTATAGEAIAGEKNAKGEGGGAGKGLRPEAGNDEEGDNVKPCAEVDSTHGGGETTTVEESRGAITRSRGVAVVVVSPLSVRVSAEAFCRTVLARVAVRDPEATGTVQISCSWELLEPPSRDETETAVQKHASSMQKTILAMRPLDLAGDDEDSGLRAASRAEDIAKRCRMHEVLYVDQDFPPTNSSLGDNLAGAVLWRRPSHFPGAFTLNFPAHTAFGGCGPPLPSDVRPCPFTVDSSLACALAALAERPRLVSAALCGRTEEMACAGGVGREDAGGAGGAGGRYAGGAGGTRGRGAGGGGAGSARELLSENGVFHRGDGFDPRHSGSVLRGGDRHRECRKGKKNKGINAPSKHIAAAAVAAAAATAAAAQAAAAEQAFAASRSGIFCARLCVGGVWKEYVLDDFFPCHAGPRGNGGGCGGGGGPCLSRAHGSALWVSMLEKVYARAAGSYTAALGGCYMPGIGAIVAGGGGCMSRADDAPGGSEGEGVWGQAASAAAAVAVKAGVVARPAKVLAIFTGAPFLQLKLGGEGERDAATELGGEERAGKIAGDLWRSIVSWVQEGWLACLSTPAAVGEGGHGARPQLGSAWKNGLRLGHAYTVLDASDVGDGNRLVLVRGPLPTKEGWGGRWAEDSPCWTPEALSRLQKGSARGHFRDKVNQRPEPSNLNGAFWVSIEEAAQYFVEAGVCMVKSPGGHQGRRGNGWAKEVRRRVSFTKKGGGGVETKTSGKGWKEEGEVWAPSRVNALSVYETSRMFFSLDQETSPRKRGQRYRDAGVSVLRLKGGGEFQAVASSGNPAQASVCTGAVLTPGRYVVVPTCTGCITQKNDEGCSPGEGTGVTHPREGIEETYPREGIGETHPREGIQGNCPREGIDEAHPRRARTEEGAGGRPHGSQFPPEVVSALMVMFDGLDEDCDGVLSRDELDAFLRTSEGLPLKDDVYTWLVRSFSSCSRPPQDACCVGPGLGDETRSRPLGGKLADSDLCLTRRGFTDMYRYMWQAAGRDLEVVMRDLRFAGCSGSYSPVDAGGEDFFRAVVSVHSDTRAFDFAAQSPGLDLLKNALILPVKRWGSEDIVSSASAIDRDGSGLALNATDNGKCSSSTRNTYLHVRTGPRGAEKAVTFAVESLVSAGGFTIKAVLDCTGSINASPLPGSKGLSREVVLLPGEVNIIQHLVPTDPRKPWSWKHAAVKVDNL